MGKFEDAEEGAFEERPRSPRRRRREEDYYEEEELPRIPRQQNWLDRQFSQTSIVLLVIFPLCCGWLALVFGIIGVVACQHPKARQNAWIVLVISIVWIISAIFFVLITKAGMMDQHGGQGIFGQ